MHAIEAEDRFETGAPRVFDTTRWSVVRAAGREGSDTSRLAMETLCASYWQPIYVYVRRKGHGPDDAQDISSRAARDRTSSMEVRGTTSSFRINRRRMRDWPEVGWGARGGGLNSSPRDDFETAVP